jgi:hypothetical protein
VVFSWSSTEFALHIENLPFIISEIFYSEISSVHFYFLTMRLRLLSQRVVIGVPCVLLISVFTVIRFYNGRYDQLASFSKESHITRQQACRIWSEWNASDRGNLRYDDYNTKAAQPPSVGDAKILGNPDVCLKAESRLDVYRMSSTEDYDWNTVQWGEHLWLVFGI